MDKKSITKTVLFLIIAPIAVSAAYYGYKIGKKKYDAWKKKKQSVPTTNNQ